jgi:hypothetical protein
MHDFGIAGGTLGHPGLLFGSRSGTRFRARASDEARPPIHRQGVVADRELGAGRAAVARRRVQGAAIKKR